MSSKARALAVKIQILESSREERGEVPCDLWGIIQTMTNKFPTASQDILSEETYLLDLKETLTNAESCFRVFKCRYRKYSKRELRPVIHKLFGHIINLIEDTIIYVKRAKQNTHIEARGKNGESKIRERLQGKSSVYDNLVLLMSEASTYKDESISEGWQEKINYILHFDDREIST